MSGNLRERPKFLDRNNDLQVEEALTAIAAYPTLSQAVDFLEGQGITTTEAHLENWRDKYFAKRYQEVRERFQSQRAQRMAMDMEDGAQYTDYVANLAVQRAQELLEAGKVKDPARVARDLQQVATQKLEKANLLQGKPTVIHENRTPQMILEELKRINPALVVDTTAEDEPANA